MSNRDYYSGDRTPAYPPCPKCGAKETAVRFLSTLRGYSCTVCKHRWPMEQPTTPSPTRP